jgi:hypothetical protein
LPGVASAKLDKSSHLTSTRVHIAPVKRRQQASRALMALVRIATFSLNSFGPVQLIIQV